jgi:D-alanyl-lipoteichoic acid acyltransferase DltB (MBOAT superfamily)
VNNFRHPYLATSIQEFWRRWHISLSMWFRDYLYIPLGGSRVSLPRHLVNLLIVMFAVGLWHGASWTFVVWGAVHGGLLAAHTLVRRFARPVPSVVGSVVGSAVGWFLTFNLVTLAWIPFRSPDLATPGVILAKIAAWIAHPTAFASSVGGIQFYLCLAAVFVVFELADAFGDLDERFVLMPAFGQAAVLLFLCVATYLGPLKDVAFLYFQF